MSVDPDISMPSYAFLNNLNTQRYQEVDASFNGPVNGVAMPSTYAAVSTNQTDWNADEPFQALEKDIQWINY